MCTRLHKCDSETIHNKYAIVEDGCKGSGLLDAHKQEGVEAHKGVLAYVVNQTKTRLGGGGASMFAMWLKLKLTISMQQARHAACTTPRCMYNTTHRQ